MNLKIIAFAVVSINAIYAPASKDELVLFFRAAQKGDLETLTTFINNDPSDFKRKRLTRALEFAARQGRVSTTEYLLEKGVQLSNIPRGQPHPIHSALENDQCEIIKLLLCVKLRFITKSTLEKAISYQAIKSIRHLIIAGGFRTYYPDHVAQMNQLFKHKQAQENLIDQREWLMRQHKSCYPRLSFCTPESLYQLVDENYTRQFPTGALETFLEKFDALYEQGTHSCTIL